MYHPGSEERAWDLYAFESVELASLLFIYHMVLDIFLVLIANLVIVKVCIGSPYEALPLSDRYNRESKWQLLAMEQLTTGDHTSNGHDGGYDMAYTGGGRGQRARVQEIRKEADTKTKDRYQWFALLKH
ncbi:hypothetical protein RRG08_007164 [Elysia crispata]|uniref:Uncharacterized protein n=1 Tax=Elysia crispata TaxID=231223 RepID=A0AAE0XYH1_9GAST|nr:hypothetical protein RRG08_007164 [Elysia crispata]